VISAAGKPSPASSMTDTIDIAEFVNADAVDPVYVDSPYYLLPDGSLAEEGYRVIRQALRDTGKIAIGQVVINTREWIVAIRPYARVCSSMRCVFRTRSAPPPSFSQRSATSPSIRTSSRSWNRSSPGEAASSSPVNSSIIIKLH